MLRILLPMFAAFVAPVPGREEPVMSQPSQIARTGAREPVGASGDPAAAESDHVGAASLAPIPDAISAAENQAPASPNASAAGALGRRILSTAFVRVGPDGLLAVTLRDGRTLVLRDVVMGRGKYCGTEVSGDRQGRRICGAYAMVTQARPGGGISAAPIDADAKPLQFPPRAAPRP